MTNVDLHIYRDLPFCYVTTTGRVSGKKHTIEIWFGQHGSSLYLLAGEHGSDWVKNLRKEPHGTVRLGGHVFQMTGRVVEPGDEEQLARQLLLQKYQQDYAEDLTEWSKTALVMALDVYGEAHHAPPMPSGGLV